MIRAFTLILITSIGVTLSAQTVDLVLPDLDIEVPDLNEEDYFITDYIQSEDGKYIAIDIGFVGITPKSGRIIVIDLFENEVIIDHDFSNYCYLYNSVFSENKNVFGFRVGGKYYKASLSDSELIRCKRKDLGIKRRESNPNYVDIQNDETPVPTANGTRLRLVWGGFQKY